MVVVSHDRHLLRPQPTACCWLTQGTVTEFNDDLDNYPRWLAERNREEEPLMQTRSYLTAPYHARQKRLDGTQTPSCNRCATG